MKNALLRVSLDDLIFEHRNKLYGAYALRKEYPRHMAIAVSAVIALFFLSIPLPEFYNKFTPLPDTVVEKPNVKVIEFKPKPLPENPATAKPAEPIAPVASGSASRPAQLPTKVAATDNDPTIATVTRVEPGGTSAADGGTGTTAVTGGGETGVAGGTGTGAETTAIAPPTILNYAEVLPKYPGGDAELAKQISKLMKYPREAVEEGIEGIVFVSFVVDPNGNVSRIKVEKGIGGGCDQEAIRVIGLLKGWSPAIQNGNPVFFKYVLPVRFVIRKE